MSTSASSSYDQLPTPPSTIPSSLDSSSLDLLDDTSSSSNDSLPSSSSQSSDDLDLEPDSDTELGVETDAEREWKESLQQLELLLTMVLVPFAGKYFGRKCAYWGWTRFMEWKYPVEIVITSKPKFRAAGILEAALPL